MAKKSTTSNTATKPRKRAKADQPAPEQPEQLKPLEVIPPRDEFEFNLRELLVQFDDHGVSLDETQWRALSDEQQRLATTWVNNRRVDVLSPVPHFLIKFASEQLKNEFEAYREGQAEVRRHLMPVTFGKPSFNKSDDGPEMTKLTLKIPAANLSDATAGALFRWKRCHVEVSRRNMNEWDQTELPQMADGDRRIIAVDADFSGYKASRHFTDVSFWLEANLIGPIEALDWWKCQGSVRIEVIGEPLSGKDDDGDEYHGNAETNDEEQADTPRRPTLPNIDAPQFAEPQTITVAFSDQYKLDLTYHQNSSGWWTSLSSECPLGWETEQDHPEIPARQSAEQAIEARIGQQVDHWMKMLSSDLVKARFELQAEVTDIISQLKAWLSGLNRGESIEQIQASLTKAEAK